MSTLDTHRLETWTASIWVVLRLGTKWISFSIFSSLAFEITFFIFFVPCWWRLVWRCLNVLRNSYPFDWTRSSLEGILHCMENRFEAGCQWIWCAVKPWLLHAPSCPNHLPCLFSVGLSLLQRLEWLDVWSVWSVYWCSKLSQQCWNALSRMIYRSREHLKNLFANGSVLPIFGHSKPDDLNMFHPW